MPATDTPPSKHELFFKCRPALCNVGQVQTHRVVGMCIIHFGRQENNVLYNYAFELINN